tara:strand:- start:2871 stop:3080 length:210 start_codon:yes stop_codon:yes gene_type:complete
MNLGLNDELRRINNTLQEIVKLLTPSIEAGRLDETVVGSKPQYVSESGQVCMECGTPDIRYHYPDCSEN